MISSQTASVIISIVFGSGILLPLFLKEHHRLIRVPLFSSVLVTFLSLQFAVILFKSGPYLLFGTYFIVDALSIFHIFLVNIVFLSSSFYMQDYFFNEDREKSSSVFHYRRFSMLWQGFHFMLLIVILSNNVGLTWVALEATTILSAFLIISESDSLSLEAMWKYLLICSVGIGLAFIGTILVTAAGKDLSSPEGVNTFTGLIINASELNPQLMLFAFIFLIIGYGTKAGLAPMHTWLPDAHSQAPTPVSAVFSSVMLNAALFVIMRYLPIVEKSLSWSGEARSILLLLGFLSLLFSAVFIPVQHDLKRLLAYCSVEHIGIIAIGLGLGGIGIFAALFHTLNHSVSKMLAFFSSGSIIHSYGTRDMRKISGVMKRMPLWGFGFLISMLVLIGTAPFSIFMSEFMILQTAFQQGRYLLFTFFLLATIAVFISILKFIMEMVFTSRETDHENEEICSVIKEKVSLPDKIIIIFSISVLLITGLYLSPEFIHFLETASKIIETGINV